MKVLAVHNFHRKGSASGDDQVFRSETKLLEEHGNEVIRYTVSNDEFDQMGILKKILSAAGMLWSFKNYRKIRQVIKKEDPDIVHVHTFFPLLSPSVLYAARRSGKKVVATLHDMRFVCPCATSLRNMRLCSDCGDGRYFRMGVYGCFKNSKLRSIPVAVIFKFHRIRRSFYKQIDRYICLNESQIKLLKKGGFCENKIVRKYNFVPDIGAGIQKTENVRIPDRYVVYFGRIGEEKGIPVLMKVWDRLQEIPLVIMGAGPLEEELKIWSAGRRNIFFLGYTGHETCLSIVKGGEFVIFPSVWYEGCPMAEIEAECLGKGLIAFDLGFSSEMIRNGFNGYKVKPGDTDGFAKTVKDLWADPAKCEELGRNARKNYEAEYLPEDNYRQLMEIYGTTVVEYMLQEKRWN